MFVGFEPISSLSFRKAYPYSPQARGPVMFGSSFIMRSTALLGALAQLGWMKDKGCAKEGSLEDPFEGVKNCLKVLGIKELKGPFAINGSELYFGEDELYPLSEVLKLWKWLKEKNLVEELLEGRIVLPRKKKSVWEAFKQKGKLAEKSVTYGIALEREKKIVKEGYFYIKERVFFKSRISMGFFVEGEACVNVEALPLGRGGVAKVMIEKKGFGDYLELKGEGKEGLLLFLSPTLLSKPSEAYERITLETVKGMLNGLGCSYVKPFPLLRRFEITLYPLGWDLVKDVQRPHVPAIVPGSALYVKCERPLKAGLYGLGQYSELGFGTALFLP